MPIKVKRNNSRQKLVIVLSLDQNALIEIILKQNYATIGVEVVLFVTD